MNEQLGILISAKLNEGSAIGSINEGIRALGKHPSLQKLDLKVDVDKSFVSSINKFVEATKKLNVALEQQQQVVRETVTTTKNLDGSIEKVKEQHLANGSVITQVNKNIDKHKDKVKEETGALNTQIKTLQQLEKELEGYTLATTKANKNKFGEVNSYSYTYKNDANQKINVNADPDGNVRNYSTLSEHLKQQQAELKKIEDLDRAYYQALKTNKEKIEAMDKLHYLALKQNAALDLKRKETNDREYEALDRAHYQALKTNQEKREAMDKLHYAALQKNSEREKQYLKTVAETELKIADIRRRYGSDKNVSGGLVGIEEQLTSLKKVGGLGEATGSVGDFKGRFSDLNMQLKQVAVNAKTATSHSISLGEAIKQAATKFPIWVAASTAFYGTIRGIKDMIQTVIEVDSQMTQLKRVMDEETNFDRMLRGSIETANEFARSIREVNEHMIGFARMGFDESQTQALAKTATLFQNISELTPDEAVDTMTAAMTVFNIKAEDSIQIADKLNEVKYLPPRTAMCA